MTATEQVVWPIEPHTRAKHEILTYYLKAWFPIQSRLPKRLLYVDGFAGPGEYVGGEPGSPILALRVAAEHSLRPRLTRPGMELFFAFIEPDTERYANLKKKVEELHVPQNFRIRTFNSTFEDIVGSMLDEIDQQGKQLAPSFVFIDPFGPTGFPMSLVERIATQPRAEVLINFSYQPLNQWFLQVPAKHPRLNELFGNERWRPALSIIDSRDRENFLVSEYRKVLEERGCRGTTFQMVNKHNQTQYYLLFGTKYYLGMLAMKRAMWAVDPEGTFVYSDLSDPNQPRLFSGTLNEDYANDLAESIYKKRRGMSVFKQSILEDELAWHPTAIDRHLTQAFRILEYESEPRRIVAVQKLDGSPRRARTYPAESRITFAP